MTGPGRDPTGDVDAGSGDHGDGDGVASLATRESGPIEVLHVDDDEAFLSLCAARIRRESAFAVTTETDVEAALARLDDPDADVDCVVSDYEMPGRDGLAFLAAVRERDPDLPFVLLTNQGNEAVAGEALSAGATDYLRKSATVEGGGFALLCNRIANAVDRYRTRCRLRAARRLRERVLEASPVGIVVHDLAGDAVFRNDRAVDILGASADELHAAGYREAEWSLAHPDGTPVDETDLPYRRAIATGRPFYDAAYVVATADGPDRRLSINGAPLTDGDGETIGAVVAFEPA